MKEEKKIELGSGNESMNNQTYDTSNFQSGSNRIWDESVRNFLEFYRHNVIAVHIEFFGSLDFRLFQLNCQTLLSTCTGNTVYFSDK